MSIKIKLTKENRKLVDIVKGDVLIFPDREETVKIVDKELGKIYSQRIIGDVEERVLYELKKDEVDYIINQDSGGDVYKKEKIEKKKKFFKIFSFIIMSIFLLSAVSATILVDGYFQTDIHKTTATINSGESITLNAIFSSTDTITSKSITVPSGLTSTENSCTLSSSGHTYSCAYTITATVAGTYTIRAIGSDNAGSTDSSELTLTVNSIPIPPVNHAPVITSSPVTSVNEGNFYSYNVIATDSDGNTLTYSLVSAPSWLSMNTGTGVISGTAPLVSSNTNYNIQVQVSDGIVSVTQTYTLTINNIPQPPIDTIPPVITLNGANPLTITQGTPYTEYGATVTDNQDIALTVIMSGFVNTDVVGTYSVIYTSTDSSGNTATKTRTVHVISSNPANNAPVITSSPVTSIIEGNIYDYYVSATDAEGDALTYSLIQAPGWLTINPNGGLITGTAPQVDSSTDYNIVVEVSDGTDTDTQSYILKVKNYISGGSSGGNRIISDSDIYYQNKYFDQFNSDKTTYTEQPAKSIFSVSTILYLILGIVGLGIIIAFFIIFRNIKR